MYLFLFYDIDDNVIVGKASDDDAVQRFKDAEKLAAMKNRKK